MLLNSGSGTGEARNAEARIREHFESRGFDLAIIHGGEGDDILGAIDSALAQGTQMFVAGGGDGTQSAVASKLAGTAIVHGVLPLGTLNHFAKDLGIPLELDQALDVLTSGVVTEVDVGEVNGRIFINNSSLGLYPDIVLDRERQRRRLGYGKWRALWHATWRMARRVPALRVHMASTNGDELVRHTPFVFIGNNEYTMEGFSIGARASLTGGELALYMTQRTGALALLRLALRALLHRLEQASDFDTVKAQAFHVDTGRPFERVATDGEVTVMQTPLRYRVRPRALRVMVPAPPPPRE